MIIVMLGPPGSGKGTQSKVLAQNLGLPHLSTGDMLRAEIQSGSPLGQTIGEVVRKGELVSDELVLRLLEQRIQKADCQAGFILDGFPRNLAQVEQLNGLLSCSGKAVDVVPYLAVSPQDVVRRISGRRSCAKCGKSFHLLFAPSQKGLFCDACGESLMQRPDDAEETVLRRISVYEANTAALVDYYSAQGRLLKLDGGQEPGAVTEALLQGVSSAASLVKT